MKKIYCDFCGNEIYQHHSNWFKLLFQNIGNNKHLPLKAMQFNWDICSDCIKNVYNLIDALQQQTKKKLNNPTLLPHILMDATMDAEAEITELAYRKFYGQKSNEEKFFGNVTKIKEED